MIVFDFVAYKFYKMVVKGKQYKGMEYMVTSFAMAYPITILLTVIITEIEKYFFDKSIISNLADMGKIPFFLVVTLPVTAFIYIYLRLYLHKIETKISTNGILQVFNKIPNFVVYFIFSMLNILLSMVLHKLCNNNDII